MNRAYQSYRQPGSAIKPLIVYAPILEQEYTPDSIVIDDYIEEGPSNADGSYSGEMTLRSGLARSKNTVAWKLFEELTPKKGLSYLKAMNFAKIVPEDERLTSALGGLTNGVSPVELASAYAALENDGNYRTPTCIVKITDADGNEILPTPLLEKQGRRTTIRTAGSPDIRVTILQAYGSVMICRKNYRDYPDLPIPVKYGIHL